MLGSRAGGEAGQEPSGGGLGSRSGRASARGKVAGGAVDLTTGRGAVVDGGGAGAGAGPVARSSARPATVRAPSATTTASPIPQPRRPIRPPPFAVPASTRAVPPVKSDLAAVDNLRRVGHVNRGFGAYLAKIALLAAVYVAGA